MKKELLKMAGVKTEREFYNLYPTPEDFFAKYPEARNMMEMRYGGIPKYKNAGIAGMDMDYVTHPYNFTPASVANSMLQGQEYMSQTRQMGGQEMSDEQAAQMQQQGAAPQQQQQITQEQIIQFVTDALMSKKVSKEQILDVLINRIGLQEAQAVQLVDALEKQIAEQSGAKGMAQQPQQQMMKYGGYSGTYDAASGSYFKMGGDANADFQVGSVHNLPQERIDDLIKKGYKVKYI